MIPLLILLIVSALVIVGAGFAYKITFHSPSHGRAAVDDPLDGEQYEAVAENIFRISHIMESISFEEVMVQAQDGISLYGRYYHVRDGAPLEILFHGYKSHAFRDCSGGHALSRKMGFNALVVDQRAHGKSGGNTICFGIMERYDAEKWIRYANKRFGSETPIILSGLSMGAATVLMAAGLDLPGNVACVVADSPYSAPSAIIRKVCADVGYPVALSMPFVHLGARLFGRFKLNETTAKDAVKKAKVPILLIHGEDDRFVPCSMSVEIAVHCASPVTVHTFPDAGHGLCYMTDPRRYERIVYDFLRRIPSLENTISETFTKQLFKS